MIKAAVTAAALLLAILPQAHAEDALGWVKQTLSAENDSGKVCGRRQGSILSTLSRLEGLTIPSAGKVLIVNLPSGSVTAYQDGVAIIESRAVVGGKSNATQTPEMSTHVTFVRPNPTWTVPESIVRRKKWREKLARDPSYFERNGFDVVVNGKTISPQEASANPSSGSYFVQRPFKNNALGQMKIGIENSQAIYLHDTNEPGLFDEEVRIASSGCVRVEKVREIAAWILGKETAEIDGMIEAGDVQNHAPAAPVKVIIGYWTAWPDEDGKVQYYPDVYKKNEDGDQCRADQSDSITKVQSGPVWTESEGR
jgi:murein L,D-transpeptidase YcbB/YkuD